MARDSHDPTANPDERLTTTRLPIGRMDCPRTARRIADALQRVDGVVETAVESRSDAVVATYDSNRTSESALTAAVEESTSADGQQSTRTTARTTARTTSQTTAQTTTQTRSNRRSGGCQCCCRGRQR